MPIRDDLDLDDVRKSLRETFEHAPPIGYVDGKTVMRDAVADRMGVSELEAEEIVDTLESAGYVRFQGDPGRPSLEEENPAWVIAPEGEER